MLVVGTPLCPYGADYRRAYGMFTYVLFTKSLQGPLSGTAQHTPVGGRSPTRGGPVTYRGVHNLCAGGAVPGKAAADAVD